jgi:hypothetical protein
MTALTLSPAERDIAKAVLAIRQLTEGRSNATGTVTLAANASATTVTAPNCAATSVVFLFPATAHAAAIAASTYVLASNITKGQFIMTHPNDTNADKTFYWVALG